ncbi:MAG: hypothetical protein KAJ14_07120 [Candidatus Omnitrophica bacterium]|nr:hypothetical protein [Candidatus Omnitrophota bacterium]
MFQKIALISAVILPLWNIPLILRIVKRKSSVDISLCWAIGVWSCFALMMPAGLVSEDLVFKVFNVFNFFMFSIVTIFVFIYRKKK